MAADPRLQARLFRMAGIFDFVLALAFLFNHRLGFNFFQAGANMAAGMLLFFCVLLFMMARRAERGTLNTMDRSHSGSFSP